MEITTIPFSALYILMFGFWFVKTSRQIMFWLYLWQLKEYHWGRFADHFATAKGKSLIFNGLIFVKLALLSAGVVLSALAGINRAGLFNIDALYDFSFPQQLMTLVLILAVLAVFGIEAVYSAYLSLRGKLLRPESTKKSLMLVLVSHTVLFGGALVVFTLFLGEMSLADFCFAALSLLLLDILAPALIAMVVMGLQPLTIYEKNKILARAAAVIFERSDLVTIGIAGSYGKSITKELLARILENDFCVLKTLANQNTEMGVATRIINDLKPEHQIFVCEIGAVHKGRIAQVAGIVKPRIGILTGINQQHLAVFGSQQNIIDAKYEILEALPKTGTAILNWESRLVRESFELQKSEIKAQKIVSIGKDIVAAGINAGLDQLSFAAGYQGKIAQIKTNARGVFMAEPILLAIAGAVAAGMKFERAVEIVNQTDFTPFNITTLKNNTGINIVSSTYSANPDGVLSHLDYLKLWPGKKAIVIPCLIELGGASKEAHFEIGKKIAQVCDLAVITTKDRFHDIKKGAIGAGMEKEDIIFSENPVEIDRIIKIRLTAGDTILLEGRLAQPVIDIVKK